MIIPEKLGKGDTVEIISPSRSLSIISEENIKLSIKKLNKLGLDVIFSKHSREKDEFDSSSIGFRVDDIHNAFLNKDVKAILTSIGGFNSNQLLKHLDYNLIKSNPKILCGYSDITALQNAIYARTGLVTYSGPHFSTFGMSKGLEYTIDYFKKCLMIKNPFKINSSPKWSDDPWYINQDDRKFIRNEGFNVINEGEAQGTIIGGNLCTLNLLQGTEFMPSLKNSILFVEDDNESKSQHFDRDIQSVLHLPDFEYVKALCIGRFQKSSEITKDKLVKIIKTKEELTNIPVIFGVNFGHTTPHITFPIGGKLSLVASKNGAEINVLEH